MDDALEWVAYDELLASWQGEFGGSDPARTDRRYVTARLAEPPESPWRDAFQGWVLGSGAFVDRVRALVRGQPRREPRREARLLEGLPLEPVCEVVCRGYQVELAELSRRGSRHEARAALAYLARQHTTAAHGELAKWLGVSRPDSVPNLTRRFSRWVAQRCDVRERLEELEEQLRLSQAGTPEKTRNLV